MDECRAEIRRYAKQLAVGTDDNDDDKRDSTSTKRYEQDLRWFDHWLDDNGIDSATQLSAPEANELGTDLAMTFNGPTPRYRWDRIFAMYDWFEAMELVELNPLAKWDGQKRDTWGMTKTTEQSKHIDNENAYPVSPEEVQLMCENAGEHRKRNMLVIKLMYHTAMRRDEASEVTVGPGGMVDRDNRIIELPGEITKNGKDRHVRWGPSLDGLMREWLDYGLRDEYLGGRDHDYLLVGDRGAKLGVDGINDIVINAADRAGINERLYADANAPIDPETGEPKKNRWKISSHNLRHGMATYLSNSEHSDMSIYELSRYLGHSSVEITESIYADYDPTVGARGAEGNLPG